MKFIRIDGTRQLPTSMLFSVMAETDEGAEKALTDHARRRGIVIGEEVYVWDRSYYATWAPAKVKPEASGE